MKKRIMLTVIAFQVVLFRAAGTILINFDTDAFGNPITAPIGWNNTVRLSELYAPLGVHFWGPDGPNGHDGEGLADQDGNFGIAAHSGRNFLGFNRDPIAFFMDGGRPRDPETSSFDTLATHVSIFAGAGNTKTFLMQGFDANGILVASDTVTTQQWGEFENCIAVGHQVHSAFGNRATRHIVFCLRRPVSRLRSGAFDDLSSDKRGSVRARHLIAQKAKLIRL
jgi:hypothetical protein